MTKIYKNIRLNRKEHSWARRPKFGNKSAAVSGRTYTKDWFIELTPKQKEIWKKIVLSKHPNLTSQWLENFPHETFKAATEWIDNHMTRHGISEMGDAFEIFKEKSLSERTNMNKGKLRELIKEEIDLLVEVKFGQPVKRGKDAYIGSTKLEHLGTTNRLDAYYDRYNTIYIFSGNEYLGLTSETPNYAYKIMEKGKRYIQDLARKHMKKSKEMIAPGSQDMSGYERLARTLGEK